MAGKIGVGIVGASPGTTYMDGGWANVAHIPALRALEEFDVRAVSSRRRESAEQTARGFDIPMVFDSAEALATCPDVDLVVITVRVPAHFELVETALAAGKAVYCEWPLGNGLAEAERMAAHAKERELHCAVGLQARGSPIINYLHDLVAQGYVGEVLSTSMIGSGMNWGPGMPKRNIYTLDKANGATLLAIATGHALDALCHCLGEFTELNATSALRRSHVAFPGNARQYPATAEDQWAISGILESGALASVHYRGGIVHGKNLIWEINGTEGDLKVTADFGNIQPFGLSLEGARGDETYAELVPPAPYYTVPGLTDPALNIAQTYRMYAEDLKTGSRRCPNFHDAVRRHRMLEAIETAAETGTRQWYNIT